MTDLVVPFNRVVPIGRELEYVREALDGGHISGSGPFTARCEALLQQVLGVPRVLLTTSCTHALEMSALLLDIQPGDEVILPAFTFVSTVNAFVLRGAVPVFVDIRDDTLNVDDRLFRRAVTSRTKAIVVVHYAGVGCEMDEISRIAGEHRIAVVEDNAHGLFATYRGRWLGRFGQLATLSFHETKNFSCGEGGALVVNDERLVERAEIIREKGTNRSRFLRGEVDKYTWMDIGSSYVLSDMLAAFLLGQLEARDAIQHRRRLIFKQYESELTNWARPHGVRTLQAPEYCDQPHHMFYLRFPNREARDTMIDALRASGILAVSHYVPLHLSAMGRRWGYREGSLPVTEAVCGQVLRLPFFTSLSKVDQQKVVDAVLATDCPTVASGIPRA